MAQDDIALARVDDVASIVHAHPDPALIWADVLWQARRNARPVARYPVFMMVAGVIAGFGVIYASTTLIVGAMAVSPDTLPVTAAILAVETRASAAVGVGISVTTVPAAAYLGVAAA